MSDIIVKPDARIETADGPICVTNVNGVRVHGAKPLTPEMTAALEKVIEAVRHKIENAFWESLAPKTVPPDCGCRGIVHTCATIV